MSIRNFNLIASIILLTPAAASAGKFERPVEVKTPEREVTSRRVEEEAAAAKRQTDIARQTEISSQQRQGERAGQEEAVSRQQSPGESTETTYTIEKESTITTAPTKETTISISEPTLVSSISWTGGRTPQEQQANRQKILDVLSDSALSQEQKSKGLIRSFIDTLFSAFTGGKAYKKEQITKSIEQNINDATMNHQLAVADALLQAGKNPVILAEYKAAIKRIGQEATPKLVKQLLVDSLYTIQTGKENPYTALGLSFADKPTTVDINRALKDKEDSIKNQFSKSPARRQEFFKQMNDFQLTKLTLTIPKNKAATDILLATIDGQITNQAAQQASDALVKFSNNSVRAIDNAAKTRTAITF